MFLFLAQACKTAQPVKPSETYTERAETKPSVVNIPIRISTKALENAINKQLDTVIYEDNRIEEDGYTIKAEKREKITLNVTGNQISYKVPLKLFIAKDLGFTSVNARASLALQFLTDFTVKKDWKLETVTQVQTYEWLEQPRVQLGGFSIPVQFIGSLILNRSKETISKAIDEQLKQNFDLRVYVEEAWKQLHEPVQLSEEYNTWVLINPQRLSMTPITKSGDTISSTIIAQSLPVVRVGEKPKVPKPSRLPDFSYTASLQETDFQIFLNTEIPYERAQELALANLKGESFSSGKLKAVIEDLKLYGQDENLVVEVGLSGSYKGNIYLTGKPQFNANRNAIDISNLDYTLDTRNFLFRSAGWLFKSNLKRRIQENMDFYMDYNLTEIKTQVQQELSNYQIAPGILLKGNLRELNLQDAWLTPEGIRVTLGMNGKLDVRVDELSGN